MSVTKDEPTAVAQGVYHMADIQDISTVSQNSPEREKDCVGQSSDLE